MPFIYKKKSNEKNKIIISDELFDGGENFFGLGNHLYVLKKVFSTPKIIFTFRRQDTFLESMYRQNIRMGYFVSVPYFLNYKNNSFGNYYERANVNLDVRTLNWNNIYTFLCELFGEENVLALPYEEFRDSSNKFLNKMCTFLDTTRPIIDSNLVKNKRDSYHALCVARFLNRFTNNQRNGFPILIQNPLIKLIPPYHKNESKLLNRIRNLSYRMTMPKLTKAISKIPLKEKNFINDDLRNKVLKLHKDGNIDLAKKLDLDLGQYGYY